LFDETFITEEAGIWLLLHLQTFKVIVMSNIVISGATGNLGKEVTQKLLESGHELYVTTRPHYDGELDHLSGLKTFSIDLLQAQGSAAFVDQVTSVAGSVQAGIFLVGGYTYGDILSTNDEDLEKMIHLNFFTAFHLVKPLIAHFRKQGKGGKLVFIGAKAAAEKNSGDANFAYTLSKSLLLKMADMINAEYASEGITATMILPEIIDTQENREAMPDADFSKWVSTTDISESIASVLKDDHTESTQFVIKLYNQVRGG
jgi:NAD(P)-dependent dehydrogenase (short-subunit alcohol dehydrogenase family)